MSTEYAKIRRGDIVIYSETKEANKPINNELRKKLISKLDGIYPNPDHYIFYMTRYQEVKSQQIGEILLYVITCASSNKLYQALNNECVRRKLSKSGETLIDYVRVYGGWYVSREIDELSDVILSHYDKLYHAGLSLTYKIDMLVELKMISPLRDSIDDTIYVRYTDYHGYKNIYDVYANLDIYEDSGKQILI